MGRPPKKAKEEETIEQTEESNLPVKPDVLIEASKVKCIKLARDHVRNELLYAWNLGSEIASLKTKLGEGTSIISACEVIAEAVSGETGVRCEADSLYNLHKIGERITKAQVQQLSDANVAFFRVKGVAAIEDPARRKQMIDQLIEGDASVVSAKDFVKEMEKIKGEEREAKAEKFQAEQSDPDLPPDKKKAKKVKGVGKGRVKSPITAISRFYRTVKLLREMSGDVIAAMEDARELEGDKKEQAKVEAEDTKEEIEMLIPVLKAVQKELKL